MPNHSSKPNSKSGSQVHLSPNLEVSPLIMDDEFYSGRKQGQRIVDNQSYTPQRSNPNKQPRLGTQNGYKVQNGGQNGKMNGYKSYNTQNGGKNQKMYVG